MKNRVAPEYAPPPQQWLQQLDAALRTQGLQAASRVALQALADGVEHPAILNLAAQARFGEGRFEEAVHLLERARRLAPNDPHVLNSLGVCLAEVGRADEAVKAYTAAIRADPDMAPAHFNLGSLLEGLNDIRGAKSAYERQDYATASAGFKQVIEGLGDPDLATVSGQSALNDLRTLAAGFRDLADKALMPPPAPKTAVVLPAPAPAPSAPRVYSSADSDVTAPVVVRQNIPAFNKPVTQRKTAVVELLVDERGAVSSAAMISPLDPTYDRLVVNAAKGWQYEPAKGPDGKPVKYQKRVQITLVPTEPTR